MLALPVNVENKVVSIYKIKICIILKQILTTNWVSNFGKIVDQDLRTTLIQPQSITGSRFL